MKLLALSKDHLKTFSGKPHCSVGASDHRIRAGGYCDSWLYRRLTEALAEELAIADEGETILVEVDSYGGEVTGLFEACFDIKNIRAKHPTKRVVAFSDSAIDSAMYALTTALTSGDNDEIVITPQAEAGSIGVIVDRPEIHDPEVKVTYVAWPANGHKDWGRAFAEMTPEEQAQLESIVTQLGETFAALVTETRGIADVAGLKADAFMGEAARTAGLVDRVVMSRTELLSQLAEPLIEDEQLMEPNSQPVTPAQEPEGLGALRAEMAALRRQNDELRTQRLLADRPDLKAGIREYLMTKPSEEVAGYLAAAPYEEPAPTPTSTVTASAPAPRKAPVTALPSAAPVEASEDYDSMVNPMIVRQFDAYMPRKGLPARRSVEHDADNRVVRIR